MPDSRNSSHILSCSLTVRYVCSIFILNSIKSHNLSIKQSFFTEDLCMMQSRCNELLISSTLNEALQDPPLCSIPAQSSACRKFRNFCQMLFIVVSSLQIFLPALYFQRPRVSGRVGFKIMPLVASGSEWVSLPYSAVFTRSEWLIYLFIHSFILYIFSYFSIRNSGSRYWTLKPRKILYFCILWIVEYQHSLPYSTAGLTSLRHEEGSILPVYF